MTAAYDGHREKCVEAVELREKHGNLTAASRASGIPRQTLQSRIDTAELKGWVTYKTELREVSVPIPQEAPPPIPPEEILLAKHPQAAYAKGAAFQLVSRPDNTFLFGACGDQHVGSKHYREDVANDLYARYERAGVQAVFNTGNWIDGEAHFNRHDLVAHGLDTQARLLAEVYPRVTGIETYAVWGADHEGWYANREGIDVGSYVEGIMRDEGRTDWHNLGFMEAHVDLVNANTGRVAKLAVVHPGGGSAYAISYRPQKILESYEGGEKPAILLLGHYHKLDAGLVRNVWYGQTGTCFVSNTRVQTSDGPKRINQIAVGDLVLTHTGKYSPVTKLFKRFHSGGFVSLNYGRRGRFDQTISATPEHPILVERDGRRAWVEIGLVNVGDVIFITGKNCPVTGERMPFYMALSRNANPMDKPEVRARASCGAKARADYAGGRRKRADAAKQLHLLNDIIPFCKAMQEQGWRMIPVGNGVTPDAIGYKDGKVVAFEIEKSRGALLTFKQNKYVDAAINEFIDDVQWIDANPRIEQPRSWYEADTETDFVKVKVMGKRVRSSYGATSTDVEGDKRGRLKRGATVYNIEVDGDNTYVAGQVVVHNCQDQSVFMRQKSIEAHVGGLMIHAEQDPETGAITGFTPSIWRYFNKGYYSNRWSKHGPVTQPPRTIGGL